MGGAPLVTQRAIGFYVSPPPSLDNWKKTLINLATCDDEMTSNLEVWRDLLKMKLLGVVCLWIKTGIHALTASGLVFRPDACHGQANDARL